MISQEAVQWGNNPVTTPITKPGEIKITQLDKEIVPEYVFETHGAITPSIGDHKIGSGCLSYIGGGLCNSVPGQLSSVVGGRSNSSSGMHSFVSSGWCNQSNGHNSAVLGGICNVVESHGNSSSIVGGKNNTASGYYSAIINGCNNRLISCQSAIIAGRSNQVCHNRVVMLGVDCVTSTAENTTYVCNLKVLGEITGCGSKITNLNLPEGLYSQGGGAGSIKPSLGFNCNTGDYSVIPGGYGNITHSSYSFIGAGNCNIIQPYLDYTGILAGRENIICHDNSFIIGSGITTSAEDTTFVNSISANGNVFGSIKYATIDEQDLGTLLLDLSTRIRNLEEKLATYENCNSARN